MPPRDTFDSLLSRDSRAIDLAATLLSALWLIGVFASYFVGSSEGAGGFLGLLTTLLVALVPVVLIWAGVFALREIAALRGEAAALQARITALQAPQTLGASGGAAAALAGASNGASPKHEARGRLPEGAPSFSSNRRPPAAGAGAAAPASPTRQQPAMPQAVQPAAAAALPDEPSLALGPLPEAESLAIPLPDLVAALQFPDDAEDHAGIRALRQALQDRELAKLIRSTQDVLTLLSQEGVFMDNLPPDLCHPDLWRRFAAGERGAAVAAVGGIRDRSSLALTAARMREDMIFRDAAHHFLRTFDRVFQKIEPKASDAEIIALANSRTARAFMLLGRVAGVFD